MILLHSGLVNFRFHVRKTRTPLMYMVFGLGGCVYDYQNQSDFILGTPRYFNKYKKSTQSFLKHIIVGNLVLSEIEKFEK